MPLSALEGVGAAGTADASLMVVAVVSAMPLTSELTSDGTQVVLRGKPTTAQAALLKPFKHGGHWKVPVDHPLVQSMLPAPLNRLATSAPLEYTDDNPGNVSPDLWAKLFPFQRRTVSSIVRRYRGRCLMAHDMGLGKTIQSIALMQHYGSPVLVLCPAFLRKNWEAEIHRWSSDRPLDVTIVSYDSLATAALPVNVWKLIVADEAHYIKHKDARRTRAALPLLLGADHAVLLSGTPCPNRPEELYTLMHALRPSITGSFNAFARRYCNARRTRFSMFDTTGSSRREELAWLLRRAFMMRCTKDQVMHEMPEKVCAPVRVRSDRTKHMDRIGELHEMMEDASPLALKALVSEAFRETCHAKLHVAVEFAVNEAKKSPTIAFGHHRAMLDALEEAGELRGLRTARIDGSTTMLKRHDIVESIQAGRIDLACLSMGAAGTGLTMTHVSNVVFMELPWNPAVLRQCEDRVYRVGQKQRCTIHYVLCDDTLDQRVWDKIKSKESISRAIV